MPTPLQLQRRMRQRVKQIARTVVGGNQHEPNSLRMARLDAYFRDYMIRHAAIRELYPEMGDVDARALADSIDPFRPSDEVVEWWMQPKPSGGFRPVCNFGIEMRVRHRIIREAVDAQLRNGEIFFDRKGQSISGLIRAMVTALHEVGPYVLSADIRNCFQSVNIDAVYDLNILPAEVVRYALDYRNLNLVRKEEPTQPSGYQLERYRASLRLRRDGGGTGPTGLLQGCSASNAILRHLLFNLNMQIAPDARIFVYADNIYVICATEASCLEALTNLSRHLAGCPAGPFLLGSKEIAHIEDGIDVLGYHLIGASCGRIDIQLSEKSLGKLLNHYSNGFRDERRSMEFCGSVEFFERVFRAYPELSDDFFDELLSNAPEMQDARRAAIPDVFPWRGVVDE